jgi:metal-sulfur cluster biosynthetic enzyme
MVQASSWGKRVDEESIMPVAVTQDEILSALKQCYDPEIPVNIVDLGLIYDIRFENGADDNQNVAIDLTLTSQGCPEHVNISAQVKARIEQLPGVGDVTVNVVWTPPWGPERLSEDAKKQLGIE